MTDDPNPSTSIPPSEPTPRAASLRRRDWRPKLRWFAAEIAVVVTGVLIALALNAWWATATQQRELADALIAVAEDFSATRNELDHVMTSNRAYIAGVNNIVLLDEAHLSELAPDSVAKLVRLLPTGGLTFDPTMGAIDALISGGDLQLVKDVSLRTDIAAWPSVVDELTEDHAILIDMYMAQQERSVALGIYLELRRAQLSGSEVLVNTDVMRTVIGDAEMLNRLSAHATAVQGLQDELSGAKSYVDRVLSLVGDRLTLPAALND